MPYGPHAVQSRGPEAARAEMTLVMRTSDDRLQLGGELQSVVSELNPEVPVSQVETMAGWIAEAVSGPRSTASLFSLFAGLALHLGIAVLLGWRRYLIFVIAPMLSGLYAASVFRSVTEHHDVTEGSVWTNARSIVTHPALEFLWSNVNYHLEHHLYKRPTFGSNLNSENAKRSSSCQLPERHAD